MKIPKFIIGENPMVENSGVFIIHTREPIFITEIHEHESKEKQSAFHDQLIKFQEENKVSILVGRDKDFIQPFTLVCVGYIATDKTADELAKIIRRMADWYQSYIKWEEKQ